MTHPIKKNKSTTTNYICVCIESCCSAPIQIQTHSYFLSLSPFPFLIFFPFGSLSLFSIIFCCQNPRSLGMATPQFHVSGRKPLQPKNTATTNDNVVVKQIKSKPKQEWMDDSNKENLNHHPVITTYANATPTKKMEAALDLDSSLAEELSAIRKKLERLMLDKEKTEKMLKERDSVLHLQMKEIEDRGQIQNHLEIEVDRLFRLKELKSYCMVITTTLNNVLISIFFLTN